MAKTVWVHNVNGNDSNDGLSYDYPKLTLVGGYNATSVGDTLRICYTGTDYTYEASFGLSGGINREGSSWSSPGLIIEGYDPSGGLNRPKLMTTDSTATSEIIMYFHTNSTFIDVRDIWFEVRRKTVSNAAVGMGTSLYNSKTYFRFTRCLFDGTATSSSYYDRGIYLYGGSEVYLEVSYCLFRNLYSAVQATNGTVPPALGGYFHHNVLVSTYDLGAASNYNFFLELAYLSTQKMDATFEHNTIVNLRSSRAGYAFYFSDSSILDTTNHNFILKDNFWYNTSYGVATAGGYTYARSPSYIGYNIFGSNVNSEGYYYNGFDSSEVDGTAYSNDKNLGAALVLADLTSYVNNKDSTWLWADSTWIYVPDLRPVHADFTGDSTSIYGIRGALPAGKYTDISTVTINSGAVSYYTRPTNWSASAGVANPTYVCDLDYSNRCTIPFTTNRSVTYGRFGATLPTDLTAVTTHLDITAAIGGRIDWEGRAYTNIYPYGLTDVSTKCKLLAHSDTYGDFTSAYETSYKIGTHSRNVTVIDADTYSVYVMIDSQISTDSSWLYVGDVVWAP